MENEDELIIILKDIKSDIATITFCVLMVNVLIIIDFLLSMFP